MVPRRHPSAFKKKSSRQGLVEEQSMARPKKQEVDYFPHYCDHGKVIFILENHFKNDGYAIFYKIEEILAKTEGHCYDCSKLENWEYLLSKMCSAEETVLGVIQKLTAMEVLDPDLWEEKRLWMQSFVDSISDAYSRRATPLPARPELLHTKNPVTGINDDINPQSKVKESKVNKRKENTPIVPKGDVDYSEEFVAFWEAYPKKVGKDAAWVSWRKRNGSRPDNSVILSTISIQKKSEQWIKERGQYIPNPSTWINQGRWADGGTEVGDVGSMVSDTTRRNVEMMQDWRPDEEPQDV